ncbi:MAG: F0F1 ATP synthase subunit B [Treponema sp.]|jgi:F-type H+-transporting ATPase subunit b|nr:F0F1 ATP synthase subunit B [Treponema sp.]
MLSLSLSTFLITLVNIGVLFFVLRAILFKPVTKFMEERSKKVADSLIQAEKDRNQAKLLLEQYENRLKNAGGEAEDIIRGAGERARQQADRIVAEAKAEAERLLRNARGQIESEGQAAMEQFRAEAAGLVLAAAAKLLRRELSREDSRLQAELLLRELGKRPHG